MDGKHPENFDQRPKRRPNEDNPYKLYTAGIKTDHPHFYLSFRDSVGAKQFMEIDKALFDAFDRFELDDLSFMNEVDNHYEHAEQTEASLNRRAVMPQESVEETVSRHMEVEALHRAIAKLPDIQRRRLILYYFGELTYQQIAEMEGCTKRAVKFSVDCALDKLKKIL